MRLVGRPGAEATFDLRHGAEEGLAALLAIGSITATIGVVVFRHRDLQEA